MRVSWQHPLLEIKNFITFRKAVNGSSFVFKASLFFSNGQVISKVVICKVRGRKRRELQLYQLYRSVQMALIGLRDKETLRARHANFALPESTLIARLWLR